MVISNRQRSPLGAPYRTPLGAFGPGKKPAGTWAVVRNDPSTFGNALQPDCSWETSINWNHNQVELNGTGDDEAFKDTHRLTWTGDDSGAVIVWEPPSDCYTPGYQGNGYMNYTGIPNEFHFLQTINLGVITGFYASTVDATAFIPGESVTYRSEYAFPWTGTVVSFEEGRPVDAGLDQALPACEVTDGAFSPTPLSNKLVMNFTSPLDLDPNDFWNVHMAQVFTGETSGETFVPKNLLGAPLCEYLAYQNAGGQVHQGYVIAEYICQIVYTSLTTCTLTFWTNPGRFPATDWPGGFIQGETVTAEPVF